ncbi:carbon-nitrogen hydrolase [Rhodococcus sp. D2-41]|uniref:CN hydrolase domain-containing protein n=1 Tax=Speluncibacter jeojiensis TaxID=2710754 RepID=A0A9X4LY58_9ACTN|nr:nitrilase-related carbon-nitrogen hydrolase [Rhodococcus sp. D2-41]MDG3009782.1 carbon-nitrogen hydrolase [Rhodococcus sp. D2-41]MDG3014533.1 hypothetical protein [Corynebacteriales bacterium D3-21]
MIAISEPSRLRVALAQITGVVDEYELNVHTLSSAMREARELGAELVVSPELLITGYDPEVAARLAPEGDVMRARVAELAADHGVAVVVSTPELGDDGRVYITATLFDAHGRQLLHHRKTRLYGREKEYFSPGDRRSGLVTVNGFRVGLAICYEIEFGDCARELALRGADLILVPTAIEPAEDLVVTEDVPRILVPARAIENQVVIAYTNHCGPRFIGRSVLAGACGLAANAEGQARQLVVADVREDLLTASRAANPYLHESLIEPGGAG